MKRKLLFIMVSGVLLFPGIVFANGTQEDTTWPTREVRLICPYTEGGASHRTDMLIKKIENQYDLLKNSSIVVTVMPGGGTVDGMEEVLNADPDGQTLLPHHNAMVNGYALGKYEYTYSDFKIICQIYNTPLVVSAPVEAPYNTMSEFMDYVKSNPDKDLKWGFAHTGGNTHFASALIFKGTGLISGETIHPIILGGDADTSRYIANKMVDVGCTQPSSVAEFVKAGKTKVLAHTGESSLPMFGTTVESFKEQGFDVAYTLRYIVFAPRDTPDDITLSIEDFFKKITETKEYEEQLSLEMLFPEFLPHEEAERVFSLEAANAKNIAEEIKKTIK